MLWLLKDVQLQSPPPFNQWFRSSFSCHNLDFLRPIMSYLGDERIYYEARTNTHTPTHTHIPTHTPPPHTHTQYLQSQVHTVEHDRDLGWHTYLGISLESLLALNVVTTDGHLTELEPWSSGGKLVREPPRTHRGKGCGCGASRRGSILTHHRVPVKVDINRLHSNSSIRNNEVSRRGSPHILNHIKYQRRSDRRGAAQAISL